MQATRVGFVTLVAAAAVGLAVFLSGPSFAKGGGGAGGGGGGAKGGSGSNTKTPPAAKKTVLDEITADSSLSKFLAALKAAELDSTLKGAGPFTVLAPNDAAFGKIDAAKITEWNLPANKAKLKAILQGHIVGSKMKAADIAKATKLACGSVSHDVKPGDDKKALIDGVAKIVKEDVEASNGYVQIVDTVLVPAEKK